MPRTRTSSAPGNRLSTIRRSVPAGLKAALEMEAARGLIRVVNSTTFFVLPPAAGAASHPEEKGQLAATEAKIPTSPPIEPSGGSFAESAVSPPPEVHVPICEEDVNDILAQMREESRRLGGSPTPPPLRPPSAGPEAPAAAAAAASSDEALADEEEFDVHEMRRYMRELRDVTDILPPAIAKFIYEIRCQLGEPVDDGRGRNVFGLKVEANPSQALTGPRRHRLFKEPELHQRVLGVLNKVTDATDKYREIKNELMRLPIPEADEKSLDLVVGVFFTKAVREQHFSSLYAQLVEELCRVPPGQIQTGDLNQSLSYRLRVALLKRCQELFETHRRLSELPRADADGKPFPPEEYEQRYSEEKKKLCGNVKFVGELYMKKIVSPRVVLLILLKLLTGNSAPDQLLLELNQNRCGYVPEDEECDQFMTLLKTTGEQFIKTELGRQIMPALIQRMTVLSKQHPTTRIRYLLLDVIESVRRNFAKKPPAPPLTGGGSSGAVPVGHEPAHHQQQPPTRSAMPPPIPPSMIAADHPPLSTVPQPRSTTLANNQTPTPKSQQSSQLSERHFGSAVRSIDTAEPKSPSGFVIPRPASQQRAAQDGGHSPKGPPTPVAAVGSPVGAQSTRSQQAQQAAPFNSGAAARSPPPALASSSPPPAASAQPAVPVGKPATTDQANAIAARLLGNPPELEQLAAEVVQQHGIHSLALVGLVADRTLQLVRMEKERGNLAAFLDALLAKHNSCFDSRGPNGLTPGRLCGVLSSVFSALVAKRFDEDSPKLWKCWCQIVAGGKNSSGGILDFSLHDDALRSALVNCTSSSNPVSLDVRAVQSLLLDIYASINACPPERRNSNEGNRFRRFRPLSVLLSVLPENSNLLQDIPKLFSSPKLMEQDLEMLVFATLLDTSKPDRHDTLFNQIRTHPKLSETTATAKILAAFLIAEPILRTNLLDSCMPLLNVAVDTPGRAANEVSLIGETMCVVESMPPQFRQYSSTSGFRILQALKTNSVVTLESVDKMQKYAEVTLGPAKAAELLGTPKPYAANPSGRTIK